MTERRYRRVGQPRQPRPIDDMRHDPDCPHAYFGEDDCPPCDCKTVITVDEMLYRIGLRPKL